MRLIETTTLAMKSHIGRRIPPYAILSHTWEDEEVTLQDWNSPARDGMKGFQKILRTCQLAASDGFKYAWVDTCCIDKSNSAELSEAINSMYRWYQRAQVCYVYLSDLVLPARAASEDKVDPAEFLCRCRWFSRGWTLQELIAPAVVRFYQRDWELVGNKEKWAGKLSDVTGISSAAMRHYEAASYSIAERMSWAASRETTREEDQAYCLLGIFDINMPMLYGEGVKAFRRLQEEIIRTGYDVSIFAWTRPFPDYLLSWHEEDRPCGAFANAPGDFHSIPAIRLVESQGNEVSITNSGVKLTLELCLISIAQSRDLTYVLPIRDGRWTEKGKYKSALGVALKKSYSGRFARTNIDKLVVIPDDEQAGMVRRIRCPGAYVMTDIPPMRPIDFHKDPYPFKFAFPQGCKVVKAWPSDKWNDAENSFMTRFDKEEYGLLLVEVKIPWRAGDDHPWMARCGDPWLPADDHPWLAGEFMFLFGGRLKLHDSRDLQYTIVGYREHQLILDFINLRMGTEHINVQEMRRTLRNFAIPRQRTAAVPVNESGQYIYASVHYDEGTVKDTFDMDQFGEYATRRSVAFVVTASSVPLENEQHPWRV